MVRVRPQVVIIGAGFGGLFTARHLAEKEVDVLIIDKNNYHTFTPLIYQVATCGLEVSDVAYPVRKIFAHNTNIDFMLGEVIEVTPDDKQIGVRVNGIVKSVTYDYLVVAAGSTTNFFGNKEIEQRSFGLKTIQDSLALRNHILRMFEKADWADHTSNVEAMTTMVVVGGGPTGLETAGALYELYNHVLRREYRHLGRKSVRVVLVEMMDNVLNPYPEGLQKSALKQLEGMGVEVILGAKVESVTDDAVHLSNGQTIPTYTLVWATGVKAAPFAELLGVELARGGRIPVKDTLELKELPSVYALGDIAYLTDEEGKPYPQLIPVAQQQAKLLAQNIRRAVRGDEEQPFKYFDKGNMATIGRNRAVAWIFNRIQVSGYIAWISWLALHLVTLLGFRNRIVVFVNWLWSYVIYDRAARLIVEAPKADDEVIEAQVASEDRSVA